MKVPSFLNYLLFFVAWFILISRNFYFYQTMFEPLSDALSATRTIGAFSFTYQSIFIFFGILILSGIISQVVSFLASDHTAGTGKLKSGGLGSWMLLIRITIIIAGVLLAFVSAGIPMDRFAIILGALSVGIGFGLQTLINNLVSGVIIAFEKPINVGDIVEITGQVGKMKSIGIRSSVVTTWDGADVIIPNGDLLNQHLVNWTLGSSRRRFSLPLGVAYGSDLGKTRQLLLDLMQKDERILKNPEPVVQANEFNNSSVDLILKFWVGHFSIGFDVKSDLILAIDVLFKEHGIVIPFPQQDVHIHSAAEPPENVNE
jgi:small-conductance mechanosensitive channel